MSDEGDREDIIRRYLLNIVLLILLKKNLVIVGFFWQWCSMAVC